MTKRIRRRSPARIESMLTRAWPALATWSVARRISHGYALAGIILIVILAVRASALEPWLWRSLGLFVAFILSLRSALVYAYRHRPSKLNWWLRPGFGENEFAITWLVYAVFFGACALLVAVF